jgi:hypothetical protein
MAPRVLHPLRHSPLSIHAVEKVKSVGVCITGQPERVAVVADVRIGCLEAIVCQAISTASVKRRSSMPISAIGRSITKEPCSRRD